MSSFKEIDLLLLSCVSFVREQKGKKKKGIVVCLFFLSSLFDQTAAFFLGITKTFLSNAFIFLHLGLSTLLANHTPLLYLLPMWNQNPHFKAPSLSLYFPCHCDIFSLLNQVIITGEKEELDLLIMRYTLKEDMLMPFFIVNEWPI